MAEGEDNGYHQIALCKDYVMYKYTHTHTHTHTHTCNLKKRAKTGLFLLDNASQLKTQVTQEIGPHVCVCVCVHVRTLEHVYVKARGGR